MNKLVKVVHTNMGYAVLWNGVEGLKYFKAAFKSAVKVSLNSTIYPVPRIKILLRSQSGVTDVLELDTAIYSASELFDRFVTTITHGQEVFGILCENQQDAEYIYNEISKIYIMDLLKA